MSSKGDATMVTADRAKMPAARGANVGEVMIGGRTECRRWSYNKIYVVAEGTPITLEGEKPVETRRQ
jgi:hypothetical protein